MTQNDNLTNLNGAPTDAIDLAGVDHTALAQLDLNTMSVDDLAAWLYDHGAAHLSAIERIELAERLTRRRFIIGAGGLLGAAALGACSTDDEATDPSERTPTGASTSTDPARVVETHMGAVEIPAEPQRVVTLHDLGLTTTALYLGFQPIGSQGRSGQNGEEFFSLGDGFSDEGLTHVGAFGSINFERIVELNPDLIIGRFYEEEVYDQLSSIAPTVLMPNDILVDTVTYTAYLADLLNRTERYEELLALYEDKIALTKELVPNPEDVTVTFLTMNNSDGEIMMWGGRTPTEKVLDDVGFSKREAVREIESEFELGANNDRVFLSLEVVNTLDADFIFNNYFGSGADISLNRSREIETGPIWQQLYAVQQNQYINSEGGLTQGEGMFFLMNAANLVKTHIGERGFVTREGGWD